MTGYECYSLYHSLKLHFTTETYDFHKYNGKSNVSVTAFENRKDKYYFYRLSRKFNDRDEMINFMVANFLHDDKLWIGSLLNEEAELIYKDRQKVIQSISYTFENDCRKLFANVQNPNDILATSGDYPILLTMALRKEIVIETVCILNHILKFIPIWEKKITDTIRWPVFKRIIDKYTAFLPMDELKYTHVLKKVLNENS